MTVMSSPEMTFGLVHLKCANALLLNSLRGLLRETWLQHTRSAIGQVLFVMHLAKDIDQNMLNTRDIYLCMFLVIK